MGFDRAIGFGVGLSVLAAHAAGGPVWDENLMPDAGDLPFNAQVPAGVGPITEILGRLDGNLRGGPAADFQDMFLINIPSPAAFSATVDLGPGGTGFDSQLWLFDAAGFGVLGNDDGLNPPFAAFGPTTTDGAPGVAASGNYFLAISGAGSSPLAGGLPIFSFLTPTEVSGPDGAGGGSPVDSWVEPGATGEYRIRLTGVAFVPAPGAASVLMLGAMGVCGRRRRRANVCQ